MKSLALLIIALAPFVSPQNQSTPHSTQIDGAPDVSIPGIMLWGKDEPGSVTFAIRVKNNGKKAIKGISWEHTLSKSPKNTPSIAEGLDGDEFGIGGASPTINSGYKVI